ncbi:MAG: FMN-binding negative transcriptional regulator [Planctomycetes bacterium]|nr:FMN-binding negative transcriptional regulator [Planctomycetota bacterium]
MYIPAAFKESSREILHALMRAHAFATLVTVDQGAPFATHLPVLLDADRGPHGTLRAHVAKANPQWQHFKDGAEVLVIFQGPHAYISPSWYQPGVSVPTWNYEAVHAYGRARIMKDETELLGVLRDLVGVYERGFTIPWVYPEDEPRHRAMLASIVGFSIEITRLEGKRKLNQNRAAADREGVIAALRAAGDETSRAVAEAMAQDLKKG